MDDVVFATTYGGYPARRTRSIPPSHLHIATEKIHSRMARQSQDDTLPSNSTFGDRQTDRQKCPVALACNTSSIWVPFSASHNPSISCAMSEFHTAHLFFLPNRDLQAPSKTNFLATFRCFSVQTPYAFFRNKAKASSSQTPSFNAFMLLLPTSSSRLSWPAATACSSHLLGEHISYRCFCRLQRSRVRQCGHLIPRSRGLARHCPCWSSYMPPHLNFLNILHPRFSLVVIPFSRMDSFCPVLGGQSRKVPPLLPGHMLP